MIAEIKEQMGEKGMRQEIFAIYKRKFPRHSSFQTEMKNYFGIRGYIFTLTLSEKMIKLKRRKELSSEYRTTSFEVEAIRTAGSAADGYKIGYPH